MKKTILASLKALSAGVMTLCVASLSFVSCYDDSGLQNSVKNLGDRLAAVEQLTAQLETLKGQIEGLYTLHFKVDAEYQLMYTFDGVNYVATGITVDENSGTPTIEQDGDLIKISVGEQSFTLEKPEVVKFEILAGRTFFEELETKEIPLRLSGIKSIFFAKVPDLWTATYEGSALTVTAPEGICPGPYSEEHWEENHVCIGANGTIEVWAATEDGKIMVGTLAVSVSNPFTISVSKDYVATISIGMDPDLGGPYQVYYGVCEKSQYDPEALLAQILNPDTCELDNNWANNYSSEEQFDLSTKLGKAPVAGEEYIVWAVTPIIEYGFMSQKNVTTVDDFAKYYVIPTSIEFDYEPMWNDLSLDISMTGADRMFAGFLPADGKEYFDIQGTLNPNPMLGGGGSGAFYESSYKGLCSSFGLSGYIQQLTPGSKYYIYVLPIDPMRSIDSYTNDDVTFFEVSTALPKAGGTASVVIEDEDVIATFTGFNISAECTSENCMYRIVKTSEINSLTEAEKVQMIFDGLAENKTYFLLSSIYGTDLEAGTEYTLIMVPIDESGKYSYFEYNVSTLAIPVTEDVTLSIDEQTSIATADGVSLKLNITGDSSKIAKVIVCTSDNYDDVECQIEALNNSGNNFYYFKYFDYTETGVYTVTGLTSSTQYTAKVFIKTTDNKVSEVSILTFTTTAQ